jgi:lysozyme
VTPVVDAGLVNFIKKSEGFSPTAQWDYKQWTYGYGTRAPGQGATINETAAEAALKVEIDAANKLVTNFVHGLPKGVEQALTDLTFNAGSGWEQGSLGAAVKAAVTSGDWSHVKADILQYNHAGGQVLAGLTARREAEVSWFDNPL